MTGAVHTHCPEEIPREVEEPPEPIDRPLSRSDSNFSKYLPARSMLNRRESLLTKQLHASESESPNEDDGVPEGPVLARAVSLASTAELTSDNDVTSPGTRGSSPSPSLGPVHNNTVIPPWEKRTLKEPVILELDEGSNTSEKTVENGLGRRRCITFACGKSNSAKPTENEETATKATTTVVEAPKRKTTITFNCPMRKSSPRKPAPIATRHPGPVQKSLRSPGNAPRQHRGSESTITGAASPSQLRKIPSVIRRRNKYYDDADEENLEARRFHEFAVDAHAEEEWMKEATCHRKRLTIKDTLQKENAIRQMGEEVAEEEAEDEERDEDALLDDLDEEDEDEDDDDDDEDDEPITMHVNGKNTTGRARRLSPMPQAGDFIDDKGFDTDDENGFANSSDSEGDSDFEWWTPGRSTAATSTDGLDHVRPSQRRSSDSSLESAREANNIVSAAPQMASTAKTAALKIKRAPTPELPDSTDFVCGTLDEDRPLEQAYRTCIAERKAAKHRVTPQDIDPTFPTSDPEMDEEDENSDAPDNEDHDDGKHALFMQNNMDVGDRGRARDHSTKREKTGQSPRRRPSPAPKPRTSHKSPAPAARRGSIRSPPLPPTNRCRLRSPPPRKLFGHSPRRTKSPRSNRPTSPPNSPRSCGDNTPRPGLQTTNSQGLAFRPTLSHTASSLPRVPTMTKILGATSRDERDNDEDDNDEGHNDRHPRGAIDIVKGLEKKRQRRKEKLYAKHCQKLKKEGERKPKPGKGAERMRELGLELAGYRGKRVEHMLSY